MTPKRWLVSGVSATAIVYAVAVAAAFGLVYRALTGSRVPREAVTGRAAAAIGDSAVFATPIVPSGVRPAIPHADAESAAVAMGYFQAPSYQVMGVPYYKERPTERRHFCGRTYYVRPVVALTDSAQVPSTASDILMKSKPAWVMPVCDDVGFVRTSVILADEPTRLRVIQGDQPGDVPELVFPEPVLPLGPFPRIVGWDARVFPDWERGVGMTPEAAVAVAAAQLAGTGARIAEVPEAFMLVVPPRRPPQHTIEDQTIVQTHACPRWRLTLDGPVMLRGMTSGQVVRTRTVYVARRDNGCSGAATLQIPRPVQPSTLPFWYGVRPAVPSDFEAPPRDGRIAKLPTPNFRSTALRVTEPVWYEEARLRR